MCVQMWRRCFFRHALCCVSMQRARHCTWGGFHAYQCSVRLVYLCLRMGYVLA